MAGCNQRTKIIRQFILDNISLHPTDIVKVVAQKFSISRQAAARHLKKLTNMGDIEIEGNTSGRIYLPNKGRRVEFVYPSEKLPSTEAVWKADIFPLLQSLPDNIIELWKCCFTEIFSNATTHSKGKIFVVRIIIKKLQTIMHIKDDGVGIFQNLRDQLELDDDENAALALVTMQFPEGTDASNPINIFLSSKMTDYFSITSKRVVLALQKNADWDWTLDRSHDEISGTEICIVIDNDTPRTPGQIFEASNAFNNKAKSTKTCKPVRLVDCCAGSPFSRSQARRVLACVSKYNIALLDFAGVDKIGPAFADQIFRVFTTEHPDIQLRYTNANKQVEAVIRAAKEYSTKAV